MRKLADARYLLLLVLLLLLLGACTQEQAVLSVAPSPVSPGSPIETTRILTSSYPAVPSRRATLRLGIVFDSLQLGMSQPRLVEAWGKPHTQSITHGIGSPEWGYTNGVTVSLRFTNTPQSATIWQILARAPAVGQTAEGLHIGDTADQARRIYQDFRIQTFANPAQIQIQDAAHTTLNVLFTPAGKVYMIILGTCLQCP